MTIIFKFTKDKFRPYPAEDEMYKRLLEITDEYENLSIASVLGVLDLLKDRITSDARNQ